MLREKCSTSIVICGCVCVCVCVCVLACMYALGNMLAPASYPLSIERRSSDQLCEATLLIN